MSFANMTSSISQAEGLRALLDRTILSTETPTEKQ